MIRPVIRGIGKSIGNAIGIPFGGASQSWKSYWANQTEVLFFGLYSEISGGQMPNKKTGSSDYLTVAGAAGSETYQCPNTAPYIAADTDYIWFKTDGTQRTTTTAELIGYDLQRTPVQYLDDSPNTLQAIMILSSAVTEAKRDRMFRDFRLQPYWDDSANDNGYIKSNRTLYTQTLWTPEAVATFIDTFTDTDGTLLTSHATDSANFTWSHLYNSIKIVSNKAVVSESTGHFNYFNAGSPDLDASMIVTIPDAAAYNGGFLVRWTDDTAHWRVRVGRASGGTPSIAIFKVTTSQHSVNISHEPGDHTFRVVVNGNNITVYWDDVKIIDAFTTDGTWNTVTNHGLLINTAAEGTASVSFDNFKIV